MWAGIVTLAIVATGCYAPTPSPGAPCGPGGACPEGLRCSAGLCLLEDIAGDAPITPDGTTDAIGDAPPPLRWKILDSSGSTGDDVTIDPTSDGTTIVVAVETGVTTEVTSISDNAGNDYERIPQTRSSNFQVAAVEIWMARDAKAGATLITAVGQTIFAVVAWEIENLDNANPVVVADTRSDQAASNEPRGVNLTTTEAGQFMLSVIIVENVTSGLSAGSDFTNDHNTLGNGWAHLTDDAAPAAEYQAQWGQPQTGTSCATSVVFRTAN